VWQWSVVRCKASDDRLTLNGEEVKRVENEVERFARSADPLLKGVARGEGIAGLFVTLSSLSLSLPPTHSRVHPPSSNPPTPGPHPYRHPATTRSRTSAKEKILFPFRQPAPRISSSHVFLLPTSPRHSSASFLGLCAAVTVCSIVLPLHTLTGFQHPQSFPRGDCSPSIARRFFRLRTRRYFRCRSFRSSAAVVVPPHRFRPLSRLMRSSSAFGRRDSRQRFLLRAN
jgi:hypothetical protein